MVAKSHSEFNQKLQPLAASYAERGMVAANESPTPVDNEKAATADEQAAADGNPQQHPDQSSDPAIGDRPSNDPRTLRETSYRASPDSSYADLYAVDKKVSQNVQDAATKMLSEYSAEKFDKAYIGSEIVGHQMMLAELKAMEESTTGDVQTVIQDAQQEVEQHLVIAQDLGKRLGEMTSTTSDKTVGR